MSYEQPETSSRVSDSGSECEYNDQKDTSSRTGRFSDEEQRVLVDLIKGDEELCRSFLHRIRARQYDKKSWMHEISLRFNKASPTKRSLDAVRHHFMLRRSGKDNHAALIWHAMRCKRRESCTKCLLLDRYRIQNGLARCGISKCKVCHASLPHVFDSFNAHELLTSGNTSRASSAPPSRSASESDQTNCSALAALKQEAPAIISKPVELLPAMTPSPSLASLLDAESSLQHQLLMLQKQQLLRQILLLSQQPSMEMSQLNSEQTLASTLSALAASPLLSPPSATNLTATFPQVQRFDMDSASKKRKLDDILLSMSSFSQNIANEKRAKLFTE